MFTILTRRSRRLLAVAAAMIGAVVVPATAQASTATLSGFDLTVTGSGSENNDLWVTWDSIALDFIVVDNAATMTPTGSCVANGSNSLRCHDLLGLVNKITVNAGNGNDVVHVDSASLPSGLLGVTSSELEGGDGDDHLYGLTSAAATDTLVGGAGADHFHGGAGTDAVDYSAAPGPVTAAIDPLVGSGAGCPGGGCEGDAIYADVETLIGSGLDDTLTGSAAADTLDGGIGDDTLNGRAGADTLAGGAGTDTATYSGATGPVTVSLDRMANDGGAADGAATDDVRTENVTGGNDDDFLTGDAGANVLRGGDGNDGLAGGDGADQLLGEGGTDVADYSSDGHSAVTVTLDGDTPNDGNSDDGPAGERDTVQTEDVTGTAGADSLTGGATSADTLRGLGGGDTLSGLAGNDTLEGGEGTDVANGGDGDDILDGGSTGLAGDAPDTIVGAAGTDTVTYATRSGSVTISLDGVANDGATGENDQISQVENATGGAGDDTLGGNSLANVLAGGAGTDTVTYSGREENLTLSLDGAANDGATGENDRISDAENVIGGSGDDTISGGSGANVLRGGAGNDAIAGDQSPADADEIFCDAGADSATADELDTVAADCETAAQATSPSVSIADESAAEGNSGVQQMTFTATLSRALGYAVTVRYATGGGTASAGADYDAVSGTVTFAPGTTSVPIPVSVHGDTAVEDTETFVVTLSDPTPAGVMLGDATGTGAITNDDASTPAAPALAISDLKLAEGASGARNATFVVALSKASAQPIGVRYATRDGNASAGSDYTASAGTLSFAPGETSKTVSVPVAGDKNVEPDEMFGVVLTDPTGGARLAKAIGIALITNDDQNCVVPRLKGKTLAAATKALKSARCAAGRKSTRYVAKVKKGRIVRSAPVAGTKLDQDARVALVISKGPRPSARS